MCCSVDMLLHILTKVDVAETAASDLAANTILVPHAEVLQTVSDVVLVGWVYGSGVHEGCSRVLGGGSKTHHGGHVCG